MTMRNWHMAVMTWEHFENYGGEILVRDVRELVDNYRNAIARRFFEWLLLQANHAELLGDVTDDIIAVAGMYRTQGCGNVSSQSASSIVAEVLSEWLDYEEIRFPDGEYRRRAQSVVGRLLGKLGEMPGRNYPKYGPSLLKSPRTPKQFPRIGLAQLNWPSITSLPAEQRDEQGLLEARASALSIFEWGEAIFDWGQIIKRCGAPPPDVNDVAWGKISRLIASVERELLTSGVPTLQHDFLGVMEPAVWKSAGFPETLLQRE